MKTEPYKYEVVASVKNKFKVPKKRWAKWSQRSRAMFNIVYHAMVNSPKMFQHTKANAVNETHWEVTAWNAAWVAASELDWIEDHLEASE